MRLDAHPETDGDDFSGDEIDRHVVVDSKVERFRPVGDSGLGGRRSLRVGRQPVVVVDNVGVSRRRRNVSVDKIGLRVGG